MSGFLGFGPQFGVDGGLTVDHLTIASLTGNTDVSCDVSKMLVSGGGGTALTDGQLLIGKTAANPVAANITAGANITITNGAGSIKIDSGTSGGAATHSSVTITDTTDSISTGTGNLVSAGGVGIAKNVYIGSNFHLPVTSSIFSTGCILVPGGVMMHFYDPTVNYINVFLGLGSGGNAANMKVAGYNNAIGNNTLIALTSGTKNNAHGSFSLNQPTTGSKNNALGYSAGFSVDAGNSNNFLGDNAGSFVTSGSGNICIGDASASSITTESNNILIGNAGVVADTGTIRIGTSGTHTATYLSGNLNLPITTNQLVLGTTNTITINGAAPAASRVYTIPDAGKAASLMLTEGAQTANGIQSFGNTTDASSISTGGVVLSGGLGITKKLYIGSDIHMTGANAAHTNTGLLMGDVISSNNFAGFMNNAMTPNGLNYAFIQSSSGSTLINAAAGQAVYLNVNNDNAVSYDGTSFRINKTTHQIVLGSGNTVTLTGTAPAAARDYSIPDVGTTKANFLMSEGAQTTNGIQTIGNTTDSNSIVTGAIVCSGGIGIAKKLYVGSDIFMTSANASHSGTGMFIGDVLNQINYTGLINSAITPNGGNYAVAQSAAGGTFLNSATGQGVYMSVNNDQGVYYDGSTFSINRTSNQLALGSGKIYTINAAAPANSLTYAMYDAGRNSSISLGVNNIYAVTGTVVLTDFQSGTQFNINSAGAATLITLPGPGNGINYTFLVCSSTLANPVTIHAQTTVTYGNVVSSDGTAVTGGAITTAKDDVIIGTTAAFGDRYDYISDGVRWYVRGVTAVHGSVTFA